MKSLNESYTNGNNKKKHSWNNNQFIGAGRIFKKNSKQTSQNIKINDISKIKKNNLKNKEGGEEKYFLPNANLNIINILNTCISKDYFNNTSFIINNREKQKDNNNSKWKKPILKNDKSKDLGLKKETLKTKIEYKPIAQTNKSNFRKLINEKEKLEGKFLKNKKNTKIEKYNNIIGIKNSNITMNNKKVPLSNKFRSKSNKRLNNLNINNLFTFDSKK